MQELTQAGPQIAGELRSLIWLLGGGMSLLILKEVFNFVKSFNRKNGDGHPPLVSDKWIAHQEENKMAHSDQKSSLGRLETESNAQTKSLIEITERLAQINRGNRESK